MRKLSKKELTICKKQSKRKQKIKGEKPSLHKKTSSKFKRIFQNNHLIINSL